jgi:hypothetical protein
LKTPLIKPKEVVKNTDIEETIIGINDLISTNNNVSETTSTVQDVVIEPVLLNINDDDNVEVKVGEDTSAQTNNDTSNLSLLDVVKVGKERMEQSDIGMHRKNVRDMRRCHDKFLSNAYDRIVNNMKNTDKVDLDDIEEQLSNNNVSQFIVNFSALKMRKNRSADFINRFQRISNGL